MRAPTPEQIIRDMDREADLEHQAIASLVHVLSSDPGPWVPSELQEKAMAETGLPSAVISAGYLALRAELRLLPRPEHMVIYRGDSDCVD